MNLQTLTPRPVRSLRTVALLALTLFQREQILANSTTIAISNDDKLIWAVNTSDNSVSVIRPDSIEVLAEIPVGRQPQAVAVTPDKHWAYVANAGDNSVSVIRIGVGAWAAFDAFVDPAVGQNGQLITGADPNSVVCSPDGKRVFVSNGQQDTITVINAETRTVIGNVDLRNSLANDPDRRRHFQPGGLAVTPDNTKLYVTRFISFTKAGGRQGDDFGKEGLVAVLDINTSSISLADYKIARVISLAAQTTGFNVPGVTNPASAITAAFPNQLNTVIIRGENAYLPNIAASPSGPLRFNLDTHAFVNIIGGVNSGAPVDLGALNLHLGARDPEPGKRKLFFANPWSMAFTSPSGEGFGYVVSAASDLLVKVKVGADGRLSFTGDDNTTRYIDLNDPENPLTSGRNAGKNPQGIVITKDGTRAYVNNAGSKNVTVIDLNTDSVIKVVPLRPLPDPGTIEEKLLVGAEIFFSSRGNFDAITGATVSLRNRLSSEGWQSCSSCHPHGLTDGVVWQFGSGPRKSVQLNSTFNPFNPSRQRLLNYSAIFDEVEDFEANIRNVSGPGNLPNTTPPQLDPNHGLLIGDDGNVNNAPGVVNSLVKANGDRAQLAVTLPGSTVPVPALTALREWIRLAIPTPNAPIPNYGGAGGELNSVALGRHLFEQVGCVTCHGGSQWTISFKDFKSPPAASEIFTERTPAPTSGNPVGTQYLNRFLREVSTFNLGVLGGGNEFGRNIGAVEQVTPTVNTNGVIVPGADALGKDYNGDGAGNGFNVPSLLGIHALQPYDHNGAMESIAEVLEDTRHWKTGGGDLTLLGDPANRAALAAFVESIDTKTPIFNVPGEPILITKIVPTPSQLSVDWIGGTGPFALQKKQELQEDFFTTVATTAELAATDIVSGRSAFYRVFDLGHAPTVWLNVALSGDAERPNAVDTGARGFGYLRVKGTNLSFTITYEGLSGPALGAAIYGPATSSQAGELLFDLTPFKGGDLSTAGRFVGEVPITAKQKAYILGNRTYVNIYTTANPSGEIRGQAATSVMTLSLSGAGERPTPVSTSASGFGVFTLVGRDLTFNLNYRGLSGPATAAHLHGAATDAGIAAPLIDLKNFIVVGSGTAGSIVGAVTLNPSQLAAVVDGQVYANIHTDQYPNGEIRGQISVEETAVPFSADLSGAGERPNAVDTSATGFVYARLSGNQLQLHGVYRGLSGPATAAHIHGPAPASGTADVLFDLVSLTRGPLGREGDFIGTIELSEIWRSILLSGDSYINIHTAANPGGEIRGQLARILLDTVLTGANERPTPIATTAFGSARVALLGHALSFQIDYSGFSSDAVAAHFHGPAGPEQTAPPLIDLQAYALGGFKRTGFILGTLATQPNELEAFVENLIYLNLHTGVNGGGEIRGQVKPILEVGPSPTSP